MAAHATPLKFLSPAWYGVVTGLASLSLAWQQAGPLMGEAAGYVAITTGVLAGLAFAALTVAVVLSGQRHPEAWAADSGHPVRHTLLALLPISLLLLSTVGVALFGVNPVTHTVWWAGCAAQLWVTLWLLQRWWVGNGPGGLQWTGVTPALFIPVAGNLLAPVAGVQLGHADWATAQFGIGLMCWPLMLALLGQRIAVQGLWTERLRPTLFLLIAPPAVAGLAAAELGAQLAVVWMCWGIATFTFLWVGPQARRVAAMPFGILHWSLCFPLAAFAALTLRLATPGGLLAVLGPALLAMATLICAVLLLGTWRGLRDGSLLAPEPVAMLTPTVT